MSTNSFFAKFLRFIGIVLMALTGGFTLLGGVGTTCAALFPTNYDSMAALAPFQWLYILFVIIGIALGVMGIRATVMLIKGTDKAYNEAVYVLLAGAVIGFMHIMVSRDLRGKSMPVDAVVYTTVLTLVIFLLFKIPAIWQGVDFSKAKADANNKKAGGTAAVLLGLLTLTIQYTMGSTHTWGGVNYANVFNFSLAVIGAACLLLGAWIFTSMTNIRIRFNRPIVEKRSA